jgi:hypothetical protein
MGCVKLQFHAVRPTSASAEVADIRNVRASVAEANQKGTPFRGSLTQHSTQVFRPKYPIWIQGASR